MKIRILSCKVPYYWYANKIGAEYEVDREQHNTYHLRGKDNFSVLKEDCCVLADEQVGAIVVGAPRPDSERQDELLKMQKSHTDDIAHQWLRLQLVDTFHKRREPWELSDKEVISIARHFKMDTLADEMENDLK